MCVSYISPCFWWYSVNAVDAPLRLDALLRLVATGLWEGRGGEVRGRGGEGKGGEGQGRGGLWEGRGGEGGYGRGGEGR